MKNIFFLEMDSLYKYMLIYIGGKEEEKNISFVLNPITSFLLVVYTRTSNSVCFSAPIPTDLRERRKKFLFLQHASKSFLPGFFDSVFTHTHTHSANTVNRPTDRPTDQQLQHPADQPDPPVNLSSLSLARPALKIRL